jgi:hypothetical protein
MQEKRLHLIDTAWRDEDEIENSKKTELQVEAAVAHIPKCESAKESCKYVEDYFVPHVVLVMITVRRCLPIQYAFA